GAMDFHLLHLPHLPRPLAAASLSRIERVFLAYTVWRVPPIFHCPSTAASLRTGVYSAPSMRCGITRRFLRSLSQSRNPPVAWALIWLNVTASGLPILSSTSASSASSGARLASTMSQNAGVFGGGAFGLNFEISRSAR